MKRSNSALSSLSVGSIINVPATGKDTVGAWKPKSIKRFAISATSTSAVFLNSRQSKINSCATVPFDPVYKIG